MIGNDSYQHVTPLHNARADARAVRTALKNVGFDVTLEEKPPVVSPEIAKFWGGYSVTFKLIQAAEYQSGADFLDSMRRKATAAWL